jgi:DNA-binding response OmpR family regulator
MKILVAEGDREAADVLAEALRLNHHAVRTGYTDNQSLKVARDFRPDVILLRRPGFDAETVKQLRKEAPVITIGAQGDVPEPVDILHLMQVIRQALG